MFKHPNFASNNARNPTIQAKKVDQKGALFVKASFSWNFSKTTKSINFEYTTNTSTGSTQKMQNLRWPYALRFPTNHRDNNWFRAIILKTTVVPRHLHSKVKTVMTISTCTFWDRLQRRARIIGRKYVICPCILWAPRLFPLSNGMSQHAQSDDPSSILACATFYIFTRKSVRPKSKENLTGATHM